MKGIILYQSKYGSTKKYADWLAEETGFPTLPTKEARLADVLDRDVIVLGGGVYASGIAGLSFLRKNFPKLKGKKLLAFCVGASPYEEQAFGELVTHNLRGELAGIPCFYCRGAWDPKAMSFVDRNLCGMLAKAVAKKPAGEREGWENALMEAGDGAADWTDRKYLEPILRAVGQAP